MPEVRPIDREKLLADIENEIEFFSSSPGNHSYFDYNKKNGLIIARHIIERQPTIEPEVRHGRWIPICVSKKGLTDTFECSECGRTTVTIYKTSKCEKAYCWNCGARMDGGVDNG